MQDLIKAADTRTLTGALEVALIGARNADGPIERTSCLDLASQINREISARAAKA